MTFRIKYCGLSTTPHVDINILWPRKKTTVYYNHPCGHHHNYPPIHQQSPQSRCLKNPLTQPRFIIVKSSASATLQPRPANQIIVTKAAEVEKLKNTKISTATPTNQVKTCGQTHRGPFQGHASRTEVRILKFREKNVLQ